METNNNTEDTDFQKPSSPLISAVSYILHPLVKLLLTRSITYPYMSNLLKSIYVKVATEEFRLKGKPQTDSRISLLSGVHRKDVKNLRPERADEYINHWIPAAIERIRAIPGLVELRAYRPVAGSHQIAATYEFADMSAFAAYVSNDDFQNLMMEVRAFVTNVSTEVWGPSPLAPEPIRP